MSGKGNFDGDEKEDITGIIRDFFGKELLNTVDS